MVIDDERRLFFLVSNEHVYIYTIIYVNNMLKHRDLKLEPLMSLGFYTYFW